ncbi:T-cell activation inhibitor, mitochondrial [Phlebotomus argentipes]|uniref:T-cell activation inhibitor, mitochondrial n=1 Tax=Phlebotomus argentipes TaxID=94469 RepID=UPI00289324EC|nr:T-cell activation inhibitor, mitochondrial [Phlebotomus argentipes]
MYRCGQHVFPKSGYKGNLSGGLRFLSNSEIATVLRPFYFVVHPDLFGRFPDQRAVNEESLKLLSAHLEALNKRRVLQSTPTMLPFYLRSPQTNNPGKMVRVPVERSADAKRVLKKILQSCELSTEYLDKIPQMPEKPELKRVNYNFTQQDPEDIFSDEYVIFQNINKVKDDKTLNGWLKNNINTALERKNSLLGLREEIKKLEERVVERLKLKDLRYECGWNVEHYRACLRSLESLANLHPKDLSRLENRILVFAAFTGISLDGHVMLFTGDVQHNWMDFIRNIPKHDAYLKKIPAYEYALSQILRKIKIGRRKFMPKTQAGFYTNHLRKVTTTLLDYLGRQQYPNSWPDDLSEYEIVIESEAGPLMVSPTGQFIAPSTCPGGILVDFITNNLSEARDRATLYNSTKHVEKDLHSKCVTSLRLSSLTKDDSVTPEKMIKCLERLLCETKLNFVGCDVFITHYYSVLADGTVCIPWDWKM